MPDLSRQFTNPVSALEYARDYLKLALSLPRFSPPPMSMADIEMRVLLYCGRPPIGKKDGLAYLAQLDALMRLLSE
jgi:hypothetical protein